MHKKNPLDINGPNHPGNYQQPQAPQLIPNCAKCGEPRKPGAQECLCGFKFLG